MVKSLPLAGADLPAGFHLTGLRCGISNKLGKKDLALFLSDRSARTAGVFTTNLVKAAPVRYCQKTLAAVGTARAVVINSGCANACTGATGDADTLWTAATLAKALGTKTRDILVASTGVIGRPLPRPALGRGLAALSKWVLNRNPSDPRSAVQAIMTTDTRPKAARATYKVGTTTKVVWGCVKGAGMIHPNMATLLSVVLTDAGMPSAVLREELRTAADGSFNRVTVDGDTSTNDSLFLLDNGPTHTVSSTERAAFRSALREVCLSLATQIAADGEGATRVAWIFVQGARSSESAGRLAATVATSALVKTALHGADPNWGRVLAALGRAGVAFDPQKVDVKIGDVLVCRAGGRAPHSEKAVHKALKKDRVTITVDLHQGKAWNFSITCDYSKEYVTINADYTT